MRAPHLRRIPEGPELPSLQKVLSLPLHHDEPLFIIIHQVYELWFKLVLHEVDSAAAHLRADRMGEATRLLRRVVEIQRLLVARCGSWRPCGPRTSSASAITSIPRPASSPCSSARWSSRWA